MFHVFHVIEKILLIADFMDFSGLLISLDGYKVVLAYKAVLHIKHCYNGERSHERYIQLVL